MNDPSKREEPPDGMQEPPDFAGFIRDHEEQARGSRWEGYVFLCLILALLVGTIVVWYLTRDIAEKDVKSSLEAANMPAPQIDSRSIDYEDVSICGTTALVVGSQGVIRVSPDRGGTWADPLTWTRNDLHAVAFGGDCRAIVAVGEGGAVLASTDGGNTWKAPEARTRNDFDDVALSGDGRTVVAVGEKGLVRFSRDGGRTWRKPARGAGRDVYRVALSRDGRTAVAVGRDSLLMVSTDGGETWAEHGGVWTADGGDRGDDFEAVALRSGGKTAVAVGDDGAVLFSADVTVNGGGWSSKFPAGDGSRDLRRNADFKDVAFSGDGQTAVAVGRKGLVWVSTDGGGTWSRCDSREGNHLEAVALSRDGGVAVAVGRDGAIVVSADPEKETWLARDGGTANRLFAVALDAGGGTLIAAGEESTILRSESSPKAIFPTIEAVSPGRATGEAQPMSRPEPTPDPGEDSSQPCEGSGEECEKQGSLHLAALIQSNFLRVGVTLLFLFMAQHLFGLVRYKLRLAAFHQSRQSAIRLVPKDALPRPVNTEELGQLVRAVSPDDLDIGHPSRTVMDRMMKTIDRLVAGGRRSLGSRSGPPDA